MSKFLYTKAFHNCMVSRIGEEIRNKFLKRAYGIVSSHIISLEHVLGCTISIATTDNWHSGPVLHEKWVNNVSKSLKRKLHLRKSDYIMQDHALPQSEQYRIVFFLEGNTPSDNTIVWRPYLREIEIQDMGVLKKGVDARPSLVYAVENAGRDLGAAHVVADVNLRQDRPYWRKSPGYKLKDREAIKEL